MRRLSLACYPAVPSPNSAPPQDYLWISDHLLAVTLSRFFRTTCPHQRRHGSNVPGPIEARRRAAKRKMTLQTNTDVSAAIPPFAFASAASHPTRQTREPSWTYQPPSLDTTHVSSDLIFGFLEPSPPHPPRPLRNELAANKSTSPPLPSPPPPPVPASSSPPTQEAVPHSSHSYPNESPLVVRHVQARNRKPTPASSSPTQESVPHSSHSYPNQSPLVIRHVQARNRKPTPASSSPTQESVPHSSRPIANESSRPLCRRVKINLASNKITPPPPPPASSSPTQESVPHSSRPIANESSRPLCRRVKSNLASNKITPPPPPPASPSPPTQEAVPHLSRTNPNESPLVIRHLRPSNRKPFQKLSGRKPRKSHDSEGTKLKSYRFASIKLGETVDEAIKDDLCISTDNAEIAQDDDVDNKTMKGDLCISSAITHPLPVDPGVSFQAFRDRIDGASPGIHVSPSLNFLTVHYLTCCPTDSGATRFLSLVLQYLLDSPWRDCIIKFLHQRSVSLPDIFNPDSLPFLQALEQHFLAPSVPRNYQLVEIYMRLAEEASFSLRQLAHNSAEHETRVGLLIRFLWDSGFNFPDESLRIASLICKLSYAFSDQIFGESLRKIWESTGVSQGPRHLADLIVACTQDSTKVPMALDLLELMPPKLLQDWVAAVFVTSESQTVPHLGQKGTSDVQMGFNIFHQLDMRRKPGLGEQQTLWQFAFSNLVRAGFERRCPSSTLHITLLLGLHKHESIAGKPSHDFMNLIRSNRLWSAYGNPNISLNQMLAQLMRALTKRSLPNHGVLELVIPYMDEYHGYHSVSNLLWRLVDNKIIPSDTAFLVRYTDQVLEKARDPTESLRVGYDPVSYDRLLQAQREFDFIVAEAAEAQADVAYAEKRAAIHAKRIEAKAKVEAEAKEAMSMAVTTATEKAKTKAKEKAKCKANALRDELRSPHFFSHILARANDARIVPIMYRNLPPRLPKDFQTELIHEFAYQYAMDRTRSCQQNWRSIRYLYRYLRRLDCPIGPQFTKAVVSVCITRPLAEGRFVNSKQAIWACKLVAEVEGREAATRVEELFWKRRGDLITRAKKVFVRLGVPGYPDAKTLFRLRMLGSDPKMK